MSYPYFFWLVLKASLFSTGGTGNFPILHQDLVPQGWATDEQFAEALAVGQVSPGPNGLWVISLGYLTYGLPGSLLALGGVLMPPLLVLVVDRVHGRFGEHPAVRGFVHGLSVAVVATLVVTLATLLQSTGIDARSVAIATASLGLGLSRRVPMWAILAGAALAGIALY